MSQTYIKKPDENFNGLKNINLQLFAEKESRTEKATPKKRKEARKKGQVFQSRELTAALGLLAVFTGLRMLGPFIYFEITNFTERIYTEYTAINELYSLNILSRLLFDVFTVFLKAVLPLLAIAFIIALVSGYAQVGFLFTLETIKFKLEKINPFKGLKRIFSLQSLTQLLKSLLKIIIIAVIAYIYIKGEQANILNLMNMDTMEVAVYVGITVTNMGIRMSIALLLLGIADYGYQWWEYERNLKMSKQELKEEYKQTEGDPEIKSKIKQKQKQISMRRMLHDVPEADVVITNPEHLATALKYDEDSNSAPVLVAKGQDYIALRIREVAKQNNVQIVEDKPLARAIYSSVDIGDSIPPELYQAVAEVLAFVYSMDTNANSHT